MLEGKRIAIVDEVSFEDSEIREFWRVLKNAGSIWVDKPVGREGNIISSRWPADLPKFNKAITKALI
jgi:putative intracellular protease/amidase